MLSERHDNFLLWPTSSKNIASGEPMRLGITLVWNQGKDIDYYVKTIRLYFDNTHYQDVSAIDEPKQRCIKINSKLCYFNSDEDEAYFASLMENIDCTTYATKDSEGRRSVHINFTPNPYTQTENHTSTSGCYAQPSYVDLSRYSQYNTTSVPLSLSSLYCYPISSFGGNMNQAACIPQVTYANSTNILQCKMPSSQMNYAMPASHVSSSGTFGKTRDSIQKRLDKEFDEYYDHYLPTKQFSRGKMPFNIVADVYVPLERFIEHIFEKDIEARYGIGTFATAVDYLNGIENGSTTKKEYWKQLQQWSTDYPFKYDSKMDQYIDTRPEKIQKESKDMVLELIDTSKHVMLKDILRKKMRSYRNSL